MAVYLAIGEVAERSGVAASALRFYGRQGLIEATRTGGNQRRYQRAVLRRIAFIQAGRAAGVPLAEIRTLAADSSSRTSVALTRIILSRRYGVEPRLHSCAPNLESMLESADAALIIGDPALRVDPGTTPYQVADLGREWTEMTGLPMVFAVWAGRKQHPLANAAREDSAVATATLRDAELELAKEITESLAGAQAERKRLDLLLDRVLPAAEATAASVRQSYQVGRAEFLTLLTTQDALYRAQLEAAAVAAEYRTHLVMLEQLVTEDQP